MTISRRTFLFQAMAGAGLLTLAPLPALSAPGILVPNITGLYTVEVAKIATPVSAPELARIVSEWPGKIAVGGARYSMGGQIAIRAGLHVDMRSMNRLVSLNRAAKVARLQAGMRWRDLQDVLDPLGLSERCPSTRTAATWVTDRLAIRYGRCSWCWAMAALWRQAAA
jgi:hypothetical protein